MTAVVLLSGGLDSAVALALNTGDAIALTVDYGQRHRRELDAAQAIAAHYNIPHRVTTVDPVLFGGSALIGTADLPEHIATEPDSTYVPARNTVLLALGVAYAETVNARTVVIGANADDAAAYPDCRPGYIEAMRDVIAAGTTGHVWIHAPLLYRTKAEIIGLARALHVPIADTYSCYAGTETPCGRCGACTLRQEAMT